MAEQGFSNGYEDRPKPDRRGALSSIDQMVTANRMASNSVGNDGCNVFQRRTEQLSHRVLESATCVESPNTQRIRLPTPGRRPLTLALQRPDTSHN